MSILAHLSALLLISVSVEVQLTSACDAGDSTTFNTFLCSDCGTLVACFGGTEYAIPCGSGEVCGNDGASATVDACFPVSDSTNTKASQCSCDASSTSASYTADPYNPAAYLACIPGDAAPEALQCTGTDVFLEGQIPPCGEAPPTEPTTTPAPTTTPTPFTCDAIGFQADESVCNKYWLCAAADDASPTEVNCDAGQVFNEATLACFDPCDSSAETFSCAPGLSGGVVDSVNCSVFHICVNGAPIGQPIPCDSGDYFDGAACVTGACPTPENPCFTCSPTTTSPSTTSTMTGSTPTMSDSTSSMGDSTMSGSTSTMTGSTSTITGSTSTMTGSTSTMTGSTSTMTGSTSTMTGSTSTMTGSTSTMTGSSTTGSTVSGSSSSPSTPSGTPFSSTTSSDSTTVTGGVPDCASATEAGYFANAETCKTFYACESDDAGGYVLKEYTCPGSLVFDPTNNYCNLANLVPGC
ncbi:unnamed protein product [Meganyctiphanes norvegica]|uniref:Chitin-binding type-2 domain-containing protein n=1 Tax=Meganyctiphanes norvegica TaxID=48144 RepID=A0AAV2RML7_MEGNR